MHRGSAFEGESKSLSDSVRDFEVMRRFVSLLMRMKDVEVCGSRLELFQHGGVHLRKNGRHSNCGWVIACVFSIPTACRRAPCIAGSAFAEGRRSS